LNFVSFVLLSQLIFSSDKKYILLDFSFFLSLTFFQVNSYCNIGVGNSCSYGHATNDCTLSSRIPLRRERKRCVRAARTRLSSSLFRFRFYSYFPIRLHLFLSFHFCFHFYPLLYFVFPSLLFIYIFIFSRCQYPWRMTISRKLLTNLCVNW
jgi:hypothetical protein